MALFRSLFGTEKGGIQFLTTKAIGYYLEKMLEEASQKIVIVSPYIKMSLRVRDILMEKLKAGVEVTIIHREDFADKELATAVIQRKNLHAKCFMTEKAVIVGSMNLYDYSQVNNDEMAFLIENDGKVDLFGEIEKEVARLCREYTDKAHGEKFEPVKNLQQAKDVGLVIGRKYSWDSLARYFSFEGEPRGGIRGTEKGNIVLFSFSKSQYANKRKDDILYYMGQNTGTPEQELWHGNKVLYTCFETGIGRIFLFEDNIFMGEYEFAKEPFKENGKWFFPLKRKKDS